MIKSLDQNVIRIFSKNLLYTSSWKEYMLLYKDYLRYLRSTWTYEKNLK